MMAGTALEYGDKMLACLENTGQQDNNSLLVHFVV